MAFTKVTADPANIAALADRPKQNNGLSAAQVKAKFDKAGVDLKAYLNDVLTEELERTTDGDSGADNIGATAVGNGTATTVQGILEEIDADVTALDSASVHLTEAETIAGVKTFSDSPIVPTPTTDTQASTKKYVDDTDGARKTYVDNLDALAVHLAGTETITGTKTFSTALVVPTPTTDTNPATKKYVDDLANARYTKTNLQTEGQSLVHWGNLTNVPNLADAHWKTPVATKEALPVTGNVLGDNRVVLDDGDGKQAVYTCVATTGTYEQQWAKVGDVDWMSEEATRQTQETARQTAEGSDDPKSGRVGAELDRVSAENARVLAEGTADPRTGRIGAELDRKDAEDAREAAELLRQAHITDKDNPHEVTAAQTGAVATADIVNTLTETGTGKVLDARQGKTLSDKIGNQTYTEDNYVTDAESVTASLDALDMSLKDTAELVSNITEVRMKDFVYKAVEASYWNSVCYGNGLFVAVAYNGTNRLMTSPDGITWTPRSVEASYWLSVCYGNGLFVAVANSGTKRVMTSTDGITWTPRSVEASAWDSVCYGNGLFVAVANSGTNRLMTSPDGITWTPRSVEANPWYSVCYGNGLFVAVADTGTNRVMTSPDGITWTPRSVEASFWRSVCYGNGLFVAVAYYGTNRVMTSPDGINWTPRAAEASDWYSVCYGNGCYGNGLFVAVANSGTNRLMTSPDGITWTPRSVEASAWRSVCYGNGLFVAVALSGTNRVMTSQVLDTDVGNIATAIGTLSSLTTTEKTNLVGAINELDTDKVETSAIVNTLIETEEGKVLDARQGKVLADLVSTNSALLKFTATNLLANSNFATASGGVATGWINGSAISGVSVADNIQYFTGAGALEATGNNHLSQPSKLNKLNHYYYLRVSAKRVSGSAALQFYLGTTYRTLVADVLEDDFKEYSVVFKQTSSTNIDFTLGADSGLAVGVQYAYACDLTETFGEQYIPDKPEIQSLMSLHENNWFDGEKQLAGLKDVYNVGAKNNRKDRVKIYGVKFTGSNPVGERTHDAVGMVAEVGVDDQLVQNDFDNVDFYNRPRCNVYHAPDGSPIVMAYEGEPGFSLTGAVFPPYADPASVFYECKPCYWNGSFDHPQVTATPMEGFELFECFQDRETPMYLPSYWLSVVGGKAASVSGTLPSIGSLNSHMTSARTYHANAHTETMAVHMYEYVLQLVEFSTKDLQTIMMGASNNKYNGSTDTIATVVSDTVFTTTATVGAAFVAGQTISIGSTQNGSDRTGGVVITSIATADGISTFTLESAVATMASGDFISTRAWRNGATDIVAASSGSPVSNTSGLYPCIWRGKVDPWAMAFSVICDILTERTGAGIAEDPYVYTPYYLADPTKYNAGTITADYIKLNLALPGVDGYAKSLGVDKRYRFIGLTDVLGAASTTYLAAYFYYPRYAITAVIVGGDWHYGRYCSPVCFGCYYSPSVSHVIYLARLSVTRS